jgi:hypothetical protein
VIIACFCGRSYSVVGDVGACPGCGEYVSLTRASPTEERQMRRELELLLAEVAVGKSLRESCRRAAASSLTGADRSQFPGIGAFSGPDRGDPVLMEFQQVVRRGC